MIEQQLKEPQFDIVCKENKEFIIAFTSAMQNMGYTYGNTIGSGFCWGKYMMIFRKANVKSKNVVARIYIRDDSIALRLFLNKVSKHAPYISAAPSHIKNAFMSDYGNCKHCKGNDCKFRKDYEIDGIQFEKCNGTTFLFPDPKLEYLADYMHLLQEFYPVSKQK